MLSELQRQELNDFTMISYLNFLYKIENLTSFHVLSVAEDELSLLRALTACENHDKKCWSCYNLNQCLPFERDIDAH